jgi:excisionase family DNA binding protein|tara:strand:+ start:1797 stop:2024 length:228 start_codon:yes stop_codon:yes gene_type:complete
MFVPIEKVARHFTVSVSTIRAWVRQDKVPSDTYIKVGNTYRFNLDAVEAALVKARSAEEFDDRQLELDFDADEDI